jgi:hypothetical protein
MLIKENDEFTRTVVAYCILIWVLSFTLFGHWFPNCVSWLTIVWCQENLLCRENYQKFPFPNYQNFPFPNCQKFPFPNYQKFPFQNCQNFPFQTIEIFFFQTVKNFLFQNIKNFRSNCQMGFVMGKTTICLEILIYSSIKFRHYNNK